MAFPIRPPVLPMLAKLANELPPGDGWIFEPKWDGFRALVFKNGDDIHIQSRDEKPLARFFPEVVSTLVEQLPDRCVLDGEIVIAQDGALDFDALQMRLHPAASRVNMLASTIPASVVFFDALYIDKTDLRDAPFADRRAALEKLLKRAKAPVHITPATRDRRTAADWFKRFEGAGLDGVVAKPANGAYESNKRTMVKVKHERECDCVVAGFRWHKDSNKSAVGSLLLGLYRKGRLEHVGVSASFTTAKRKELVDFLKPFRKNALDGHPWREWAELDEAAMRKPGAQSRWSQGKDMSWEPIRPELVVQVAYDHMQRDRFRHTARFRRWRDDKKPKDCTYGQLEVVPPHELKKIFSS
jgi:ATP-dependent DNA ligase